jgi:hypothetical protein
MTQRLDVENATRPSSFTTTPAALVPRRSRTSASNLVIGRSAPATPRNSPPASTGIVRVSR